MTTEKENIDAEEAFKSGFYDIPSERQRASMSILEIAELLASSENGSVRHIVLSHELNLKISKKESMTNLRNVWIGGIFTIIGAVLGSVATFLLTK